MEAMDGLAFIGYFVWLFGIDSRQKSDCICHANFF